MECVGLEVLYLLLHVLGQLFDVLAPGGGVRAFSGGGFQAAAGDEDAGTRRLRVDKVEPRQQLLQNDLLRCTVFLWREEQHAKAPAHNRFQHKIIGLMSGVLLPASVGSKHCDGAVQRLHALLNKDKKN